MVPAPDAEFPHAIFLFVIPGGLDAEAAGLRACNGTPRNAVRHAAGPLIPFPERYDCGRALLAEGNSGIKETLRCPKKKT
jgi:hypothetical protein